MQKNLNDVKNDDNEFSARNSSIEILPVEILLLIFSQLSIKDLCALEKVNSNFNSIAQTVWTEKHELILDRKSIFCDKCKYGDELDALFNFEMFQLILRRLNARSLKLIDFSDYRSQLEPRANDCLETLAQLCPNLKVVKFNGLLRQHNFAIYEESFCNFARQCTRLTEIDFSHCTINDSCLNELIQNCCQLKSLNIAFCDSITGECFKNASLNLSKLKVEQCTSLKDEYLFYLLESSRHTLLYLAIDNTFISKRILHLILNEMCHLEVLQLQEMDLEEIGPPYSSSVLTHLNTLDLSYSSGNDDTLSFVLFHCANLKQLILNNCENLSDKMFTLRPVRSPLEKLNLFSMRITDLSLGALKQCSITLKWLKLMGCIDLTGDGMADCLLYLPNLQYLDVRFTTVDNSFVDKCFELEPKRSVSVLCQGSAVNLDEMEKYSPYFECATIFEHFFRNFIILRKGFLTLECDTNKENLADVNQFSNG